MNDEKINPQDLNAGPILHAELPLVLADLHPEHEVVWWEHVARCYAGFAKEQALSSKQKAAALQG